MSDENDMAEATGDTKRRPWGRRRFLGVAGRSGIALVALGAAGYGGHRWPHGTHHVTKAPATPAVKPKPERHFVSRPDLKPPRVHVYRRGKYFTGEAGKRMIMVAPKGYQVDGPGQNGVMVLDTPGHLVWFRPTDKVPMDLKKQTYKGDPVLTWWQGDSIKGHGEGECVIVDTHYKTVAVVHTGDGLDADLHEFHITRDDTALVTAYRTADADLSAVGGPKDGRVYSGVIQEIDIGSGKVLMSWDSLDHIPVTESELELSKGVGTDKAPYDYFHINSIVDLPGGDLLVSARNTWTVYRLDRTHGHVKTRIGGKKSDYTIGHGAHFYWQHDARPLGEDRMTVFDNGSSPAKEPTSRGLVLRVDKTNKKLTLEHAYTHPARLLADNQGSIQVLPDGRAFVGWGNQPYFSEFTESGTLILDGRFPDDDQSYRAFTDDWTGEPADPPALVVRSTSINRYTLYASWNGSTRVRRWRALAGKSAHDLTTVAHYDHDAFETRITVNNAGPCYAVEALDEHGKKLARSDVVTHKA